jgi:hypothetical protein
MIATTGGTSSLRALLVTAALAAAAAGGGVAAKPTPGLDDVCAGLPTACSPELCDPAVLRPGAFVQLAVQTYYHNMSVVLPPGASVVGAGINQTFVVACGVPSSGRRGFILGNDSYVGHLTWQGLQASRGDFDAAVGTPGCLDPEDCGPAARCIPEAGDCAGVQNATVEHIHVLPYYSDDGANATTVMWPLSTSAGWFPRTRPWGPERRTGSVNITLRGIVSWGTWADGVNFHGGHHNVLVERCEINYSGDDPYGLWPVSADARADANSCQQNIVLRDNIARWPRQYAGDRAGGTSPRDHSACDCSDAPRGQCYSHTCYATYGGGAGVMWVNNSCEGARDVVAFYGDYPNASATVWCGPLATAGNK